MANSWDDIKITETPTPTPTNTPTPTPTNTPAPNEWTVKINKRAARETTLSLKGAVYYVYTDENCTERFAPAGTPVKLVTDKNGHASYSWESVTPPSVTTLWFKEIEAPEGFQLDSVVRSGELDSVARIVEANSIDDIVITNTPTPTPTNTPTPTPTPTKAPSYFGVKIKKVSATTKEGLENAVFSIYSNNSGKIKIKGSSKQYGIDEVILTITSNSDGIAQTEAVLPAGKYYVKETAQPTGYLLLDKTVQVDIPADTENGKIIDLTNGENVFENDFTKWDFSKVDMNGTEIAGATMQVLDSSNAVAKTSSGEVCEWVSDGTPHRINMLPVGKYVLHEETAAKGYTIATDIPFEVTATGVVCKVTMTDKKVTMSKTDVSGEKEIAGATITVTDKETGEKVDEWVSGNEPHDIDGLKVSRTYILSETVQAKGYVKATDIEFTVTDDGVDQKVTMVDKIVKVTKVDAAGKALEGAKMQVLDLDKNVIDEWVSGKKAHAIENLVVGQTYILREKAAPDNYVKAVDMKFTVADDGKDQKVIMKDKQVFVKKTDVMGEEVPGAHLAVYEINGDQVSEKALDSWISTEEAHIVKNLKAGHSYRLVEEVAADAYVIAQAVDFTVTDDGIDQTVVMVDKQQFVIKTDTKFNALTGAEFEVREKESGNVVDTWTSDGSAHAVNGLKVGNTYVIVETKAPKGYVIAAPVEFTVSEDTTKNDDEIGVINKQVKVTKTDMSGENEVVGAKMSVTDKETGDKVDEWVSEAEAHAIENLMVGRTYVLHETAAPEGFVKATDIEFTVEDNFTDQSIVMIDKIVYMSKVDVGGEELPGAEIVVYDTKGKEVDRWTSTTEPHVIKGLKAGKSYVLHEEIQVKGYVKASDVPFKVADDGIDQKVQMVDKRVLMSKYDLTGQVEVSGASMSVKDAETNEVADEWVSSDEPHYIDNLVAGRKYILSEVAAPEGFVKASDIEFEVPEDNKDQKIEMIDKKVLMSKTDATGEKEIAGATITVTDKETGEKVDEWVSGEKPHEINGLEVSRTYILSETIQAEGYVKASDIEFTVADDGVDQKVIMVDKVVTMSKVDVGGKEVEGAKIQIIDSEKNVVDEWISGKEPHIIVNLEVGKTYTMHEETSPKGYVKASDFEFTVTDDGVDQHEEVIDERYIISKTDITGAEEVPGASLEVIDAATNEKVDAWISTTDAHYVEGLEVGKTYILREIVAPKGYVKASEIEFEVVEDGVDGKTTMVDEREFLSKKDITDGTELEGAKITVTEKESGETVDEWISGTEPHPINGLETGKTYVITETAAPKGYVTAESIEFTVTEDGIDTVHEMLDDVTKVNISKHDITDGKEIAGAKLLLRDSEENIIEEWISGDEPHYIEKLPVGKYTLTEIEAPEKYEMAETITFTIEDTGDVQTVKMFDSPYRDVEFSKSDATTGEEVEGAKIVVRNENGETVEEWISGKEPHKISLHSGTYTMTEIIAPENYEMAETVTFTVKQRGEGDFEIDKVEMKDAPYRDVRVSKYQISGKDEIEGAELAITTEDGEVIEEWVSGKEPHQIYLPAGKYVMIEKKPADGYVTAEAVKFRVEKRDQKDDIRVQHVMMYDDITKVSISKQDVTNSKELPGAKLRVEDKDGKLIEEWISTNEPHMIEKLKVGEYTLTEITAPNGYQVAEKVKFKVFDTGEIQHVIMYDSPKPTIPVNRIQTGDNLDVNRMITIAIVILFLAVVGGILITHKKKM